MSLAAAKCSMACSSSRFPIIKRYAESNNTRADFKPYTEALGISTTAGRSATPAQSCRSWLEGTAAHLIAHRDDGRVRERTALPVRAVDYERVAGDEPRVRRREEGRGPAELADATDPQRGLHHILL